MGPPGASGALELLLGSLPRVCCHLSTAQMLTVSVGTYVMNAAMELAWSGLAWLAHTTPFCRGFLDFWSKRQKLCMCQGVADH